MIPGVVSYPLMRFPDEYLANFTEEILIRLAKDQWKISDKELEKIHADCLKVPYIPSNLPADVWYKPTAWSCKGKEERFPLERTDGKGHRSLDLHLARCCPSVFGWSIDMDGDPQEAGKTVIAMINQTMSSTFLCFPDFRLLAVLHSKDKQTWALYEEPMPVLDMQDWKWQWSPHPGNLWGTRGDRDIHWQQSGGQTHWIGVPFRKPTIMRFLKPKTMDREAILEKIGYQREDWRAMVIVED